MTCHSDLDPRDRILQDLIPTVMVPAHTNFPQLDKPGHRYLIASDGLYIEVCREWMHAVCPIGTIDEHRLPYGDLIEDGLDVTYDPAAAMNLIKAFIVHARAQMPNECAAWIIWTESDEEYGTLRLEYPVAIEESPGHVKYYRPKMAANDHMVIDIHSHGALGAHFSHIDDEDDEGDVKLAVVVGRLDQEVPEMVRRLCLPGGLFISFDGSRSLQL